MNAESNRGINILIPFSVAALAAFLTWRLTVLAIRMYGEIEWEPGEEQEEKAVVCAQICTAAGYGDRGSEFEDYFDRCYKGY